MVRAEGPISECLSCCTTWEDNKEADPVRSANIRIQRLGCAVMVAGFLFRLLIEYTIHRFNWGAQQPILPHIVLSFINYFNVEDNKIDKNNLKYL